MSFPESSCPANCGGVLGTVVDGLGVDSVLLDEIVFKRYIDQKVVLFWNI